MKVSVIFCPILVFPEHLREFVKSICLKSLRAGVTLGIPVSPACLKCSFAMKNIFEMALTISVLCVPQWFRTELNSLRKENCVSFWSHSWWENHFVETSFKDNDVEGESGEWWGQRCAVGSPITCKPVSITVSYGRHSSWILWCYIYHICSGRHQGDIYLVNIVIL